MGISIEYRLVGTGWAECCVALDGKRIEITASYLSDCLAGLADVALLILGGATSARCSFDEEPGEYRWVVDRVGSRLRVRILEFQELWGNKPDVDGVVVLDGECDPVSFINAVRDAMQCVLDAHGEEGYRDKWVEHAFPTDRLRTLREGASRMGA